MNIVQEAEALIDVFAEQNWQFIDKAEAVNRLGIFTVGGSDRKDMARNSRRQHQALSRNEELEPGIIIFDVEAIMPRAKASAIMTLICDAQTRFEGLPKYSGKKYSPISIKYLPSISWFDERKHENTVNIIIANTNSEPQVFKDLKESAKFLIEKIYSRGWYEAKNESGATFYEKSVQTGAGPKYDYAIEELLKKMAIVNGLPEEKIQMTWPLDRNKEGWVLRIDEETAKILLEQGFGKSLARGRIKEE